MKGIAATVQKLEASQLAMNRRILALRKRARELNEQADALSREAGQIDRAIGPLKAIAHQNGHPTAAPAAPGTPLDDANHARVMKAAHANADNSTMRLALYLEGKGEVRAKVVKRDIKMGTGTLVKICQREPEMFVLRTIPQEKRGGHFYMVRLKGKAS